MARSWTTAAYLWLFRDSPSWFRTFWSTVIKSPNFCARGRAPPVRLLQGALVILGLKQTSQSRHLEKLCFLDFSDSFGVRSESESWETCAGAGVSAGRSRNWSSALLLWSLILFGFFLGLFGPVTGSCNLALVFWSLHDSASGISWESWNYKRYVVLNFAFNCPPFFGQPWLFDADPLIGISVVFAEFSER